MLIEPSKTSSDLNVLLDAFPTIRFATAGDAGPLADFINSSVMTTTHLQIGFTRGDDYFSLLRLQGEKYATLICEENGKIEAIGALTLRKAFVRGKKQTVGYLQDLRVSSSAPQKTRVQFYKFFAEFIRICPSLPEFDHCALFLTAILEGNVAAKAALSRAAFPLEYTRLAHYTAYTWPRLPGTLMPQLLVREKTNISKDELMSFYRKQFGPFAFDLTTDDIERVWNHSHPIIIQTSRQLQAACLLVQTDSERCLKMGLNGLRHKFDGTGRYIFALRVAKQSSPQADRKLKNTLIHKALLTSLRMPGLFTGFVSDSVHGLSRPLNMSSIQVKGSLYRVHHPEHTRLKGFSDGFLRPSHTPALEWVFM
ncbi:MAG: hypothetical protein RJB13_2153 [Pseudomonadota bacterium]|jgi:hypothetical protein